MHKYINKILKKKKFFTLTFFVLNTAPILASSKSNDVAAGAIVFSTLCCSFGILAITFIIPLIFLIGFIINIILIIDATDREFEDENSLIIWILVLLFVNFPIGTILYYYLVMKKYPKKN